MRAAGRGSLGLGLAADQLGIHGRLARQLDDSPAAKPRLGRHLFHAGSLRDGAQEYGVVACADVRSKRELNLTQQSDLKLTKACN